MAWSPRVALVALCGVAVFGGLALGAESHREELLEPDPDLSAGGLASQAAGTLIPLTGLLVAAGATAGAVLLSDRPWRDRLVGGAGVAAGTYLTLQLVQGAWPNYAAFIEGRVARLSTNLLAVDDPAVPSLWIPIFAYLAGGLLIVGSGAARLLRRPGRDGVPAPEGLLRRQAAASALAVPFLAVGVWGPIRLLLNVTESGPGPLPHLVILPLAALACAGLIVTQMWRLWALAAFVRNGRLAAATEEAWLVLGRAEAALVGALVLLAVLSSFLPAAEAPGLQAGATFGVTLRGHGQFLAALLIPLVPALRVHRLVVQGLRFHRSHLPSLETSGGHPVAVAAITATGVAFAAAGLATFTLEGGLVAWLVAALPMGLFAWRSCSATGAAPPLLLAAFVAWALGNGVRATFDEPSGIALLRFETGPGVLALWRVVGALLGALALARLATRLSPRGRPAIVVPLAAGLAAALAILALVELPLSAWIVSLPEGQAVGLGSLVSSQDPPVRFLLHTLAGLSAAGAALLAARLRRPEWFTRPRRPVEAEVRVKWTAPAG